MTALPAADRFDPAVLGGVDEPVARFLRHAIAPGAPLPRAVRLTMDGRIALGRWVPFTADQETRRDGFAWRARVGAGPLTVLRAVDRFAAGAGAMDVRLLGRVPLVHADDADTARSAAARTALEAAVFAPALLVAGDGVRWRAEAGDHVVVSWAVPPEHPEVHLRIGADGELRAAHALRWDRKGTARHAYLPCGCDVEAERRFGAFTVPSAVTVSWWYGTARQAPFFRASITGYEPVA